MEPPVRIIEGQATKLARVIHQFALDPIRDELAVPQAFSQAILFFKGGVNGEEAPIRIIQGPKTKLGYTDNVELDPVHNEVFTAQSRKHAILVFKQDANGDVAPIRIIHGPKTRLNGPWRVAVDPTNDMMVVATWRDPKGILIFKRTDNGDVAPQAIIAGPKTGMKPGIRDAGPSMVTLYPEGKKMFVPISGAYDRTGNTPGHIAVWKYTDNGDVEPWAVIKGPNTKILAPFGGAVLNPETKEIMVLDIEKQALFFYHIPELFEKEAAQLSSIR